MYVAVHHSVDDPDVFWETVGESIPELPEEFTLHHCLPDENGSEAVCVWEAPSVDAVRTLIEDAVGEVSTNDYIEVESSTGVHLPSGVVP